MTTSSRSLRLLRTLLIVALMAIWLGVAAVGGRAIGQVSTVTTNNADVLLPADAESVTAREELAAFDDTDTLPALIVIQHPDVVEQALGPNQPPGPPGTVYAEGLLKGVTVEGRPLSEFRTEDPAIAVAATDGSGIVIVLSLSRTALEAKTADGGSYVGPTIEALREQAASYTDPGAETHVTGPAGFIADIGIAFSGLDGLLLLVALATVLVILLIVYRSIVMPVLVLLSAVSGLSLAGFVVYHLADSGTIIINGQAQGILFILVVGAATDYALLLVARYREELTRHASPWQAMTRAWRSCLGTIAASAGTVALGLLCLLAANLNSSRYLGPVGAIAIGSAVLASLTFLPALLLLGRWVFWPRIPRPATGADEPSGTGGADAAPAAAVRRGFWQRLADLIGRHPRRVWIGAAVLLVAGAANLGQLQATGTTQSEIFLNPTDAAVGEQILEQSYDIGQATPIRIIAPAEVADEVAERATAVTGIEGVRVGETVIDGRVVVDAIPTDPEDATDEVEQIRAAVHPLAPGEVLVGGQEAERLDTRLTAERDLIVVIPLVLLVIMVLLTLLLRSIVAALMLTVANVLSFAATMGVSALVFNHLFDFPGADPTVPLLGFVFLVALGVDYSIFLMARAREEVVALDQEARRNAADGTTGEGQPAEPVSKRGVQRALVTTGGVITSAGIVLAATFAALGVIPLLFLVQLAFIVAFGVLLDTFVVRSLLVPGLAIDLGRRTWWPRRITS
ncbi:MMPL family transporter [Propionibacteriaceae bacterium Y2011]|uniref:MMPL family transporter n=1 Tax=Microlunatus sp. Y2014 TaxID=3418488 RepID=UPI003B4A1C5D